MNDDVETNYINALYERRQYENQIYDYLVDHLVDNLVLNPDDTFWEPVKICLNEEQISQMIKLSITDECPICLDQKESFTKLECCNQQLCTDCCKNVFFESVKCPYCKQDQRTLKEISINK